MACSVHLQNIRIVFVNYCCAKVVACPHSMKMAFAMSHDYLERVEVYAKAIRESQLKIENHKVLLVD